MWVDVGVWGCVRGCVQERTRTEGLLERVKREEEGEEEKEGRVNKRSRTFTLSRPLSYHTNLQVAWLVCQEAV